MAFDNKAFSSAKLEQRVGEMKCPELASWFSNGDEPVIKFRGLTGEEFYSIREAVQRRHDYQAIASRLASGSCKAIADAISELYGEVPDEYVRRVELIIRGCVDPSFDRETALKLFKYFPNRAHAVADEIWRLTGEGATVGELKGSGSIPASATTST